MKHDLCGSWSSQDSAELYQVNRWSEGFFGVSETGRLQVFPNRNSVDGIDLFDLVEQVTNEEVAPPALIRFPQIAQQRVRDIHNAFDQAIRAYGFSGGYSFIFPIKVSQHYDVVLPLMDSIPGRPIGLEAGSKAELLAVIATARPENPILCNGFKDAQYVDIALRAIEIGRDVTIIVEKPSEFDLIREGIQKRKVVPKLGVRVKLAAKGVGHWESTGGTKSKFGLTISDLLLGLKKLEKWDLTNALRIVHFHLGSQITEIRFLKNAVIEATRIYADLVQRGIPIDTIDVGGGLGVDYCGNRAAGLSGINYSLQEYANDVVYHIQSACDQTGVPHPNIYSESGRAAVAHHSLFVIPVMGQLKADGQPLELDLDSFEDASPPIRDLRYTLVELSKRNVLESYHDAEQAMEMAGNLFRHGHLTLQQRAEAETLFREVCRAICDQMSFLPFVPEELEALQDLLADNNYGNFSLFRSLPDHWAIGQLFPVVPIHRLNEKPTRRGVLSDITCDSDGKVKRFVSREGETTTLHLHALDSGVYYLAVLLVGAYQEILGDSHNLFGRVNVITAIKESGELKVKRQAGDRIVDVLDDVGYSRRNVHSQIRSAIDEAVAAGKLSGPQGTDIARFYEDMMNSYTYLAKGATVNPMHDLQTHQRPKHQMS